VITALHDRQMRRPLHRHGGPPHDDTRQDPRETEGAATNGTGSTAHATSGAASTASIGKAEAPVRSRTPTDRRHELGLPRLPA
jgi:hypothetical protein